jgi:hypothetical protein
LIDQAGFFPAVAFPVLLVLHQRAKESGRRAGNHLQHRKTAGDASAPELHPPSPARGQGIQHRPATLPEHVGKAAERERNRSIYQVKCDIFINA